MRPVVCLLQQDLSILDFESLSQFSDLFVVKVTRRRVKGGVHYCSQTRSSYHDVCMCVHRDRAPSCQTWCVQALRLLRL